MRDLFDHDVLPPEQYAIILEVYESARRVEANLPSTHIASIAARRLIAAFNGSSGYSGIGVYGIKPH
ncbi:hypothetical protein [Aminobacter sp. HY435]|uniref:hypothetical protein n=1 Tax=Aminobacter sp. HY435 TaxID=2970917 RepID=UPI0022B96928|nr:hypothetical protein [Aminobacter sp. HY435]